MSGDHAMSPYHICHSKLSTSCRASVWIQPLEKSRDSSLLLCRHRIWPNADPIHAHALEQWLHGSMIQHLRK